MHLQAMLQLCRLQHSSHNRRKSKLHSTTLQYYQYAWRAELLSAEYTDPMEGLWQKLLCAQEMSLKHPRSCSQLHLSGQTAGPVNLLIFVIYMAD